LARAYGEHERGLNQRGSSQLSPGAAIASRQRMIASSSSPLRISPARIEKLVVIALCVTALLFHVVSRWPVSHAPGILVPEVPVQTPPRSVRLIERDGYQLTPLADYAIRARVLGTERYRIDGIADLVPLDLALGWRRMSDSGVLDRVHLFQVNRHFFYWMASGVIAADDAKISAANTHVIPADDAIRAELFELKEGDIVRLTGQLVEVTGPKGLTMRSSLRRDDSGDGACEIVYVQSVEREPR
jgi:hypothetical protein